MSEIITVNYKEIYKKILHEELYGRIENAFDLRKCLKVVEDLYCLTERLDPVLFKRKCNQNRARLERQLKERKKKLRKKLYREIHKEKISKYYAAWYKKKLSDLEYQKKRKAAQEKSQNNPTRMKKRRTFMRKYYKEKIKLKVL